MKYIIILLLIIGVGFYFYSKHHNAETEFSFEVYSDHIKAVGKDWQYVFSPQSSFETEGIIMAVSHENNDPFCGSFLLVWGDTAIELASYSGRKVEDIFDQLSVDAQNVVTEQGCPAPYINDHSISLTPLATNIKIERALRAIKQGDKVSLEGYKASIVSAQYKGNSQSVDMPNIVCITKAVINNETYGE